MIFWKRWKRFWMPVGRSGLHWAKAWNDQLWGPGCQRSGSHEAKDRSAGLLGTCSCCQIGFLLHANTLNLACWLGRPTVRCWLLRPASVSLRLVFQRTARLVSMHYLPSLSVSNSWSLPSTKWTLLNLRTVRYTVCAYFVVNDWP